jgi:Bacterial membrane protein YfhO
MVLLLYLLTALVCLWLARPISRAAALVLLVLPLGITGLALISGQVYGPVDHIHQYTPWSAQSEIEGARNASAVDIWTEFFPWRAVVRESFARGEWPLWNPYNLAGHPLAGEAQSAPYSPFTLIACLLAPAVSQTYTAAIVLFLAGLSAFLFARSLGCGEGPSLFAAAGWGLASCIVLYSLTAMGNATAYAPLVLFGVRRLAAAFTPTALILALSLSILAGHPESLFLNVIVGALYAIFELIRRRTNVLRVIATAIFAGVAALLLCAIALLPLIDAIPQSIEYLVKSRGLTEVPHGVATKITLASLATNAFPYLHVRSWQSPKLGYIGAETAAVGSLVLALALYAVWRRRSAETWFFAGLGLFCILAGARWWPIAETLHDLPLLNITLHDRLAFHGALCLVILAALGVEQLLQQRDERAAAITFACVFVLLAVGTWWLQRNIVLDVTPADYGRYRILAELVFLAAAALYLAFKPRVVLPVLLALLIAQRTLEEIDTFGTYPAEAMHPPVPVFEPLKQIEEPFRIVGRELAMPPAMNTFYGLEDPRGYEALTLAPFVKTWKLWCRVHGIWFNRVDDLTAPFLSLMNVRFAIQADTLPVPAGWRLVARQPGAMLLENPAALERIFIPAKVVITGGSTEEIVDRMATVTDFRAIAWITARDEPGERDNGPGTIALKSRSLGGRYEFTANMQREGYVVISDASWRGWQASIDGKRVPLSRANAAFLAVRVPAGTHDVRLIYRPVSFVRGRAISFVTLIALVIITAVARRSRRTRSA